MRFLLEWLKLFFKGESQRDRLARGVGFAAAVGASLTLKDPVKMAIEGPWGTLQSGEFPLGFALTIVAGVIYALITVWPAWIFSRGPRLVLGESPEFDLETAHFRLRVWNQSDSELPVAVWIDRIVDETGTDVGAALGIPSRLPLELLWSHHPPGERQKLSKTDVRGGTVSVGAYGVDEEQASIFAIPSRAYPQPIPHSYEAGREIWVHVRATAGRVQVARWLGFEPAIGDKVPFKNISRRPPRAVDARRPEVRTLRHA